MLFLVAGSLWAANRRAKRSIGNCRARWPSCSWWSRHNSCRACSEEGASPAPPDAPSFESRCSQMRHNRRKTLRIECWGKEMNWKKGNWSIAFFVMLKCCAFYLPCSTWRHCEAERLAIMSRTRDALGRSRKGIQSGQQLGNSDTCHRTNGALVADSNRVPAISRLWFSFTKGGEIIWKRAWPIGKWRMFEWQSIKIMRCIERSFKLPDNNQATRQQFKLPTGNRKPKTKPDAVNRKITSTTTVRRQRFRDC